MKPEDAIPPWLDKSITSPRNPAFSTFLDCLESRGIKKHGLFLVYGEKAVADVLARHAHCVRYLLVSLDRHVDRSGGRALPGNASMAATMEKVRRLSEAQHPEQATRAMVMGLDNALYEQLDRFGTHAPILALATPDLATADLAKAPAGLEILCALSDPSNLGALIRSAAAFHADSLVLLKESASPFHPRAVRAASAATLEVPLLKGPSIADLPRMARCSPRRIIALDVGGEPITSMPWPADARILVGEEGRGIPDKEAFQTLAIPMAPGVESLNAAVAASIALYAYRAQHPL